MIEEICHVISLCLTCLLFFVIHLGISIGFWVVLRGGGYWKLVGLKMRLHKHIHIHKGIRTMLGVRWFHALLALPFIAFLFFLVCTNNMGQLLFLFGLALWPYYNLIVSHASSITFLLTTSNLVLYLLLGGGTTCKRLQWLPTKENKF